MKTFELLPTKENLIYTYKNDIIQRNAYLHRFIELLNSIDDGFSIALGGKWGSGKTFFVKQAKMIMDVNNRFIKEMSDEDSSLIKYTWNEYNKKHNNQLKNQVCVYYDSWKYDNDDDPLLSLIYEIANELGINYDFTEESSTAEVFISLIDFLKGLNIKELYNTMKSQKNLMEGIEKERKLTDQINTFFDSVLAERGDRLIIFIDELDRCKPSYAVNLLEKIKHYFSNERVTFVFSINNIELINTIQKYYGQSFDSGRYLDRFFDLRLDLPPIDKENFLDYMGFKMRGVTYIQDKVVLAVVKYFGLEMREITRFLKLIKVAVYKPAHTDPNLDNSDALCIYYIIPVMLGLKMYNTKNYYDLIQGKDCTPLIDILSDFKNNKLFKELLKYKETYEKLGEDMRVVKIEDKITEVYDALFNTQYTSENDYRCIGSLTFTEENKQMIEETINLFSIYTDLN